MKRFISVFPPAFNESYVKATNENPPFYLANFATNSTGCLSDPVFQNYFRLQLPFSNANFIV